MYVCIWIVDSMILLGITQFQGEKEKGEAETKWKGGGESKVNRLRVLVCCNSITWAGVASVGFLVLGSFSWCYSSLFQGRDDGAQKRVDWNNRPGILDIDLDLDLKLVYERLRVEWCGHLAPSLPIVVPPFIYGFLGLCGIGSSELHWILYCD